MRLNIIKQLEQYASLYPQRIAVRCGDETITYKELWYDSEQLALWLMRQEGDTGHPVAVYGHKHPWMVVCFLACVKSGRAYCPIDISVPDARVELILQALPSGIVLATETLCVDAGEKQIITRKELAQIFDNPLRNPDGESEQAEPKAHTNYNANHNAKQNPEPNVTAEESKWVSGSETFYIIFTSGSTGTPKGVQISADCLNHYLDWSIGLGNRPEEKNGLVFLNQAPFSFDLSVMDLYTALASGGTLYCLEKTVQGDYRKLMEALEQSKAGVWVSTPSFAELCLAEPCFSSELMTQMQVFLFCGETLANRTAEKLQKRFPDAVIVNTYGPTESTVAVTDVLVTENLCQNENPLPVGRAKKGTSIEIWDPDGRTLPDGEKGEIIILGNTVSTGYYGRPDLTEKAFFTCNKSGLDRGYHTGDKGYLKDGMLYYCGRMDLQIKLHGYRIELEDIENNIRKLPGIAHAVVLPNSRGGKITSLTAYIVRQEDDSQNHPAELSEGDRGQTRSAAPDMDNKMVPPGRTASREETAQLRNDLQSFLPDYMIPKKFVILEWMPVTGNGKADRKRLGGQIG
jgi:D-alanine--poly(phosphoribitol) ligase subunit 1